MSRLRQQSLFRDFPCLASPQLILVAFIVSVSECKPLMKQSESAQLLQTPIRVIYRGSVSHHPSLRRSQIALSLTNPGNLRHPRRSPSQPHGSAEPVPRPPGGGLFPHRAPRPPSARGQRRRIAATARTDVAMATNPAPACRSSPRLRLPEVLARVERRHNGLRERGACRDKKPPFDPAARPVTVLPARLPAAARLVLCQAALPPWRVRAERSGCAAPCWGTGRTCGASPVVSFRKAASCPSHGTEPRGSGPLTGECWASALGGLGRALQPVLCRRESVEVPPQGSARAPLSSSLQSSPPQGLSAESAGSREVAGGGRLFAGGFRDWHCRFRKITLRV